jgi:hypothetical protein
MVVVLAPVLMPLLVVLALLEEVLESLFLILQEQVEQHHHPH